MTQDVESAAAVLPKINFKIAARKARSNGAKIQSNGASVIAFDDPIPSYETATGNPFRFVGFFLVIGGLYIYKPQKMSKIRHVLLRVFGVICGTILAFFLVTNAIVLVKTIQQKNLAWTLWKSFALSATAFLTFCLFTKQIDDFRELVDFYRINFSSWQSLHRRQFTRSGNILLLIIWLVIVTSSLYAAINGCNDAVFFYTHLIGRPVATACDQGGSVSLRLDTLARSVITQIVVCFSVFLYGSCVGMAHDNLLHLNAYINSVKLENQEDPAELIKQLRNLYFNQSEHLRQLNTLYGPLVFTWFAFCGTLTISNAVGAALGEFPGTIWATIIYTFFMESFPLYCIVWGAGQGGTALMDIVRASIVHLDSLISAITKRHRLENNSIAIVTSCIISMGLDAPRLTLWNIITLSRFTIALFALYIIFMFSLASSVVKLQNAVDDVD